ncbi:uncharacterized protein NESG_00936 [Nematocida ausubeli]|uniref:Uncharacterized protein n=1 Tax=Nematocida ausubeli (strain ATCC PRA-371 / ERTm2) TaxID=1913371 RepID=A0A086J3R2_NEMA1|nr:uncharacterized protein NESG_00936 [Nematocida ausubeli]KFG26780.1 hypothetical protein NESG_00936 [Nematocida ausubeli]
MIYRVIAGLFMVQNLFARVSVEDIRRAHETKIKGSQQLFINSEGPLNLLCGYMGFQNGYMYNKRFFSPKIETDYALYEDGLAADGTQEYGFTRTPANDKIHKELGVSGSDGRYLSAYHAQLLKMFPSEHGDLSIETTRPNALTNFLRADHVKQDAKYILAALLLLSEEIDVQIGVDHSGERKRLVIKSKTCKGKKFADVELYAAGIDPATNLRIDSIYQSEVEEIVNFCVRCKDRIVIRKAPAFVMPSSQEAFDTGDFLNSLEFLMQTYIYHFIDSLAEYASFVEAVHELLLDQMTEEEKSKLLIGQSGAKEEQQAAIDQYNTGNASSNKKSQTSA